MNASKPTPQPPSNSKLSRRQAVAGAGAVGALVAGAAALPLVRGGVDEAPAAPAQAGNTKPGYQVTQHVLRYYETTRV